MEKLEIKEVVKELSPHEMKQKLKKNGVYIKGLQTQIDNLKIKVADLEAVKPPEIDIDVKALLRHIATLRVAHVRLPRGASRAFQLLREILNLETLAEAKQFFEENK